MRANAVLWEVIVASSTAPPGSKRHHFSPSLEKSKKLIFRLPYISSWLQEADGETALAVLLQAAAPWALPRVTVQPTPEPAAHGVRSQRGLEDTEFMHQEKSSWAFPSLFLHHDHC